MLEYLIICQFVFFGIHCVVSAIRRIATKSRKWLKYSMEKRLTFGAVDVII